MSASEDRVPTVAAVVTSYWPGSHADLIVGRIVEGRLADGAPNRPRVRVVSMYVDRFPPDDLSRDLSRRRGVPIFPSIREALTLGGSSLAVDGRHAGAGLGWHVRIHRPT